MIGDLIGDFFGSSACFSAVLSFLDGASPSASASAGFSATFSDRFCCLASMRPIWRETSSDVLLSNVRWIQSTMENFISFEQLCLTASESMVFGMLPVATLTVFFAGLRLPFITLNSWIIREWKLLPGFLLEADLDADSRVRPRLTPGYFLAARSLWSWLLRQSGLTSFCDLWLRSCLSLFGGCFARCFSRLRLLWSGPRVNFSLQLGNLVSEL